ncbi:MAG: S9 family peptidase [Bradymonadia bacterium]
MLKAGMGIWYFSAISKDSALNTPPPIDFRAATAYYTQMKYIPYLSSLACVLCTCLGCVHKPQIKGSRAMKPSQHPPIAKRVEHFWNEHGVRRSDPYHWMRDDERKNPEIIDYLKQENAFTEAVLTPTTDLQKSLFEELKGRLKPNDSSVPTRIRSYWYYTRYEEGKEHPIFCRRKSAMTNPEEIILDANTLAKAHAYYAIGGLSISENEQRLAFAEDTLSRRIYTIRFKDLKTGEILEDKIEGVEADMAWAADDQTIFYVDKDEKTLRPHLVKRHQLGTSPETDVVVHDEADESFYVSVRRSKSRKYVLIEMDSTLVTETRFIDASAPHSTFEPILQRRPEQEYDVEHHGDTFYIRINENAPNFKLVAAPITTREDRTQWREVVAASTTNFLAGFDVFRDHLVIEERVDGQRRIRTRRWSDSTESILSFDEPVHAVYTSSNPEFDTDVLRISYSSLTTPTSVYDHNMTTGERNLLKQDEVLGGFDSKNYRSERLWVKARDGEQIPVSIVYRRGFEKNGTHPFYLYAYGSYGYSMDPSFAGSWVSLLDRGFGVAIAHIRGGQEMGRRWYDDGKMFNKMNTFTDFIDVADALVEQGYTSTDMLVAGGGSAGGLLMGVVANLRPELFRVIYAAVPFVDVVSTMLDDSIPLTTGEYDEWGNPNNKDSFDYMLSYSPYDQVKAQSYPHMIVTTGLHDSQVQYWEPAKWVARLRELDQGDKTILLDVDLDTGHGGASGRYKRYEKTAMVYAFMMYMLDSNLSRWALPQD